MNKAELIAQIEAQRDTLSHETREFTHAISPKSRFSDSVVENTAGWLIGAGLTGVAFAGIFFRRRSPRDRKPIVPTSVKSLVTLVLGVLARTAFAHYAPLIEQRVREKMGALTGGEHTLMLPAPVAGAPRERHDDLPNVRVSPPGA